VPLVDFDSRRRRVEMDGACPGCHLWAMTLHRALLAERLGVVVAPSHHGAVVQEAPPIRGRMTPAAFGRRPRAVPDQRTSRAPWAESRGARLGVFPRNRV